MSLYDITDRRQAAEVRYRRLFEAAKDGIVIIESKTGDILDTNPFITKLSGFQRTELLGRKISDHRLIEGEAVHRLVNLSETDTYRATIPLHTKDGGSVDVEVVANGYLEGSKPVVQLNIRDVSARVQAEETQRREEQLRRDAEKMEAVGRLAGGVAHDFNNLVTAVVGYSDLLKARVTDQAALRDLERIGEAGRRASVLTRQLLAFGRKQTAAPAIVDLNAVIAEMKQILSVIVTERINLVVEPGRDVGLIKVDRGQIEQVVTNLVMNARDAMPDGGRITITTSRTQADERFTQRHPSIPAGDYVILSIADTGTGMDSETQSHLFEPFFTTKPRGLGTGLGLATIHGIVKQSGGHVWAYSELGHGTTFEVYLPHVEAEGGTPDSARSAVHGPAPRGTETILLVEDEPLVRRLASTVLKENGYNVLEAANGPEALRLAGSQTGDIDLLLTDVIMPRMSEAADRLASERADMKVLFMSGHPEDALSHHGVLDPEFAFLPKPFTPESLSFKVREVLDDDD